MRYRFRRPALFFLILCLNVAPQLSAQSIPAKGTEATLDVATWNIEWFGSASNGPADDALQLANVRAVIEQADIDLWGVQEISDPDDFDALLAALGDGYRGALASESGTQRIGFIYKTDVFSSLVVQHILRDFAQGPFAGRPPLQLAADVTLADTTARITFIVLHMKAFGDQDSYDRRVEAARRLKNHIDFTTLDRAPVVVLGDFNDALTRSIRAGQPSPYDNFLQDSDDFFFPSLRIEQAGLGTFCGNNTACVGGATVDHILITDELLPAYEADSAERFDALLDAFDGTGGACAGEYVCTTSDHLPVFARFRFRTRTATERADVLEAVAVAPAYPNPFAHTTTLAYTLVHAAAVRVEVFDVLGRRRATLFDGVQPPGQHRATFDADGLPGGVYLIRVSAGGVVDAQRVVRVR